MNKNHYICQYKYEGAEGYFIWSSNNTDGVLIDDRKKMLVFADIKVLESYAKERNIYFAAEIPSFFNFDDLQAWISKPSAESINASEFLSFWNIFTDIAISVGACFDEDQKLTRSIYDKLFYANNLPSVNQGRSDIRRSWSIEEVKLIAKILQKGLQIFCSNIHKV